MRVLEFVLEVKAIDNMNWIIGTSKRASEHILVVKARNTDCNCVNHGCSYCLQPRTRKDRTEKYVLLVTMENTFCSVFDFENESIYCSIKIYYCSIILWIYNLLSTCFIFVFVTKTLKFWYWTQLMWHICYSSIPLFVWALNGQLESFTVKPNTYFLKGKYVNIYYMKKIKLQFSTHLLITYRWGGPWL